LSDTGLYYYPIFNEKSSDAWADDSRDCSDGVGNTHEYGRVLRGDVQMVNAETSPSKATCKNILTILLLITFN